MLHLPHCGVLRIDNGMIAAWVLQLKFAPIKP
jgi:hypothetical protein